MIRVRLLPALLCSLLAACAAGGDRPAEVAASHPALARELAFTHTHEIRFGESLQVVGYLVEFLRLPDGIQETRDYPAGTVLLQDRDFHTIGLITPGREGLALDDQGEPRSLGHGGRDALVSAIFGRSEAPRFQSILPGLPPARR